MKSFLLWPQDQYTYHYGHKNIHNVIHWKEEIKLLAQGDLNYKMEKYSEAASFFEKALGIFKQKRFSDGVEIALCNLY